MFDIPWIISKQRSADRHRHVSVCVFMSQVLSTPENSEQRWELMDRSPIDQNRKQKAKQKNQMGRIMFYGLDIRTSGLTGDLDSFGVTRTFLPGMTCMAPLTHMSSQLEAKHTGSEISAGIL